MDRMPSQRVDRAFKYDYEGLDVASIKQSLANRMIYAVGKDNYTATDRDWFHATAYVVRDRLIERWMETMRTYYREDAKRVYYFSLEFLIGRSLINSLLNLGFCDEAREALFELGLDLEAIADLEFDAALGNGGLGRLAACFLDSMATLSLPGYGYGIRYEYGMFRQAIENGHQVEHPDNWLRYGNPWEFPRPEVLYPVEFYGEVVQFHDERGHVHHHWQDTDEVMAMAYDTPIPGYGVDTVNNMRLWSAKASRDFDLRYFNEGNYIKAVEDKTDSENLSKVLYPSDETTVGRELRLKQQYFFVSASLQDIIARFLKQHDSLLDLPDKVAIQLNDTHPSIAIPELMRLLIDRYHHEWETAWEITTRVFGYTNHTLLPEALETWPVPLFEQMLPRHLQIIYEINHHFLNRVVHHFPGDVDRLRRMSLIDEEGGKRVRMAHLAIIGSHKVNGVAAIHTKLLKERIFRDFHELMPERFINVTNGITPRLWLHQANPALSGLISRYIGHDWITDLPALAKLTPFAEDDEFLEAFRQVKRANKESVAASLVDRLGVRIDPSSLFDVQVKRLHEYKRQLLNLLHVVTLYNRIRNGQAEDRVPRTVMFAGKAAPSYRIAKLQIELIHAVADIVNNDPRIGDRLKVLFIPNYDVSTAVRLIPSVDLSEQISTAGTEASGTGNMKLALNGALTIGTLDGANIEIRQEVGKENIFIFGNTVEELEVLRRNGYDPKSWVKADPELRRTLEMIGGGYFSPGEPARFKPIVEGLLNRDRYFVLADYRSYVECQKDVDRLYHDPEVWTRRAVLNTALMGNFSSDRAVQAYAEKIWGVKPERNP
ncbi:glycogen/starch/alpha-glucan phosphorylase [Thiohalomonas denitrificans]|uniref:glycogen/starch/alpha-glucan phosphorylase n=1 Tax=Thiohalomonas denitrificans TaxID=415747 RepID=UPI0039834F55